MVETDPTDRDGVSRLSRRGLLALGATLAGTSGIGMFSGTAAAHELMAFRDAFIGDDGDKEGLGSKGWLFFAKNTGTIYYHNGSGWVDLGIGGRFADSDEDGLLEAPNHDGIDVGQVEADSVSTGERHVDRMGACVYLSSNQPIPGDDSWTKVTLDATTVDHHSGFDKTNNKYVVQSSGTFYLSWYGRYKGTPDPHSYEIRVNGSRESIGQFQGGGSGYVTNGVETFCSLNSGDEIEFYTRQRSGSSVELRGNEGETKAVIMQF